MASGEAFGGVQALVDIFTLDQYALTTVDSVRKQLGMPASVVNQDLRNKIEKLINACSAAIESFIERQVLSRSYAEIYDGRGTDRLVPQQWPILSIDELWIDTSRLFTDPANQLPVTDYAVVDEQTAVELLFRQFSSGRYSTKIVYTAGFTRVPYDISYACDLFCEWLFRMNEREDIGRTTRSKGDESVNIEQSMPTVVVDMIRKYKRLEFGGATPRSIISV